jgi:hypothetical protein
VTAEERRCLCCWLPTRKAPRRRCCWHMVLHSNRSSHAELATLTTERVPAGGGAVEITRMQITDTGRRVLAYADERCAATIPTTIPTTIRRPSAGRSPTTGRANPLTCRSF